jgi:hypothetical protein
MRRWVKRLGAKRQYREMPAPRVKESQGLQAIRDGQTRRAVLSGSNQEKGKP